MSSRCNVVVCDLPWQLNLSSNMLKDRAIVSLMKGFETNKSLQELDLSYNLWEDAGAAAIGKMLVCTVVAEGVVGKGCARGARCARPCSLVAVSFTRRGAAACPPPLVLSCQSHNNTLTTIGLSWNKFRRDGAKSLAIGLKSNTKLQVCACVCACVGDDGGTE